MNRKSKVLLSGSALLCLMFPNAFDRSAVCYSAEPQKGDQAAASSPSFSANAEVVDLSSVFNGYTGTFLMLNEKTGKAICYNPARAKQRFSPCSTFKIFNALAGLDCGVLSGKDDLEKWDGKKDPRVELNKDHTLQSAMKDSVVWYFQRVAQKIGEERMKNYLHAVHYGNMDMSAGLTRFWLSDDSIKLSADEQIEFLRRLDQRELPFSEKAMDTVSEIIKVKKTDRGELSGKTGTLGKNNKRVMGWFVGYVKHDNDTYIFATNIAGSDVWGAKARQITERILEQRGLL
ncbi:MAG: hypothetical protein K2X77_29185 [Candidatus Obscuribacterales bacterium]|nr:hypothetical protein [Candidatus Obscuribacterales bacterium]